MLKSSGIGSFVPASPVRPTMGGPFSGCRIFSAGFGLVMWYYDLPPEQLIEKLLPRAFVISEHTVEHPCFTGNRGVFAHRPEGGLMNGSVRGLAPGIEHPTERGDQKRAHILRKRPNRIVSLGPIGPLLLCFTGNRGISLHFPGFSAQ